MRARRLIACALHGLAIASVSTRAHTLDSKTVYTAAKKWTRPHRPENCTFSNARPQYALTCPAGLKPNPVATVVTSYMHTPSKRPSDVYLERMRTFMHLKASVVAFVDFAYVQTAEAMARHPDDVIIVPVTFSQFRTMACGLEVWQQQHAIDIEKDKHAPTLYPVWAEKATMVATAARANCFESNVFVWLDVGYFSETPVPAAPYPTSAGIQAVQPGKVLYLAVEPKSIHRVMNQHMQGRVVTSGIGHAENVVTLGGGGFAGDAAAVTFWERAYMSMLDRYHARGWFMGKDQNLFTSVCLEQPNLCLLHNSNKRWFDLIPLLTGEMRVREWSPYNA